MLQVLSGKQITFVPFSESDQRLKGEIILMNPDHRRYILFKIKSTDISIFQTGTSRGILSPSEKLNVSVITTSPIVSDFARTLSQKYKFQIEYMIVDKKPQNAEQMNERMKTGKCETIILYVNANSVRDSKLGGRKQGSIADSGRFSFRSMVGQSGNQNLMNGVNGFNGNGFSTSNSMPLNSISPNINFDTPEGNSDEMARLKNQIQLLQKQRARLSKDYDGLNRNNQGNGSIIKYIILFGVGLVAGNIASKYTGLNQKISQSFKQKQPQPVELVTKEQQGFWSIFNFGGEEEQVQIHNHVQVPNNKSWWDIF